MDGIRDKLMEELNNPTAFTIPLFGGIPVGQSVVITWGIMAVLVLLSILCTRHLKRCLERPSWWRSCMWAL